jgi:hypothetical protein
LGMTLTFLSHRKPSGSSGQTAIGFEVKTKEAETVVLSIDAHDPRKPTTNRRVGEVKFGKFRI